ncbi:hypothetical protein Ari01nite_52890 [Paractinoplanes rishiriensis]|uniref:Uncharacterized protein n=1 Tax=Paractinoplanes rishiriensis TaxID=1050105 RepID=A0A919MWU0_9ACTN|nr:hypothetical protein Ari01nite_52890 [Actinoplanes rishiriensis]
MAQKRQTSLTQGCGVRYSDAKYHGTRTHGVAHCVRCAKIVRSGADETQGTHATMVDTLGTATDNLCAVPKKAPLCQTQPSWMYQPGIRLRLRPPVAPTTPR